MWSAFLYGVGIGLSISLLLGPNFFAQLQTTIQRGFWAGVILSVGITVSDIMMAIITYSGLSQVSSTYWFQTSLSFFGGAFLILFGARTALKTKTHIRAAQIFKRGRVSRFRQFTKGFLLNTIHPGVWIFWIGVSSILSSETLPVSEYPKTIFVSSILVIFLMGIAKSYLANYLKSKMALDVILWINRIIGVVILIMGIVLIVKRMIDVF